MDLFSPGFVTALLAIIAIDLVLAGDNAIVIALVARRLPPHLQRMTIIAGTAGAVAVRVLMTLVIVWLLNIPWLQLAGGLLLVWIAWKLLAPDASEGHGSIATGAQATLGGAIRTIVVADAVMGLDNVLGVAGAAHGNFVLVVIGLAVSVPIMILGSTLILKWVERYPAIIYGGAGILAWTAAKMITSEPMLASVFEGRPVFTWGVYAALVIGVLANGMLRARRYRELADADYPAVATATAADPAPAGMPHAAEALQPVMEKSKPTSNPEESEVLRILVPVDGSRTAMHAVRQVLRDVRRANTPHFVLLMNVQPLLPRHAARFIPARVRDAWRRDRSRKAMEEAMTLLRHGAAHFDAATGTGDPARSIARCADERGMHRIVMGTQRKSALARFFGDSVTSRVMELATVPVEVVAPEENRLLDRFGIPAGLGAGLALLLLVED